MPTVAQRVKRLFSREKTGSQNVYRNGLGYAGSAGYGAGGFGIPRIETNDEFNKRRRTNWACLVRRMQCEPTIALLQMLYVSQVVSPGFSIDADEEVPEDIVEKERARTKCLFEPYARAATMGLINWGWSTFENVQGDDGTGELEIKKLKPLLHDLTAIEVYDDTGDVAGVSQGTTLLWKDEAECIVLSWNVEGTNWYGRALMKSLEIPYLQKLRIEKRAEEFDGRVAAAHWVVYYPPGNDSIDYGEDGKPIESSGKDNQDVALEILTALLDTGSAVIPSEVMSRINELNDGSHGPKEKSAWRIELLKSVESGGTSPYQDRLKYKDVEFARGLGFLERAVFEGQTGTRADAEQHSENSALGPRDMANYLAKELTEQALDPVIEINYGEEYVGKIRVIANPLSDAELDRIQKLYDKLLNNSDILLSEYDSLDLDYISDRLNLPRNKASDETDLGEMDFDDLEFAEDLSCVMLKLPENGRRIVHAMQSEIPFADLADADGKVDDPHVTVKYGLHEEHSRPVFEALKAFGPVPVKIGSPKVFKNAEADIVVLSVESPALHSLNAYVSAMFDTTDAFPVYSPHVTVAYVRKGLGAAYAKKFDGMTGQEFILNELVFSDPNRWKDETELSGSLVLSECGANKEGGGRFTKGNTCANGGKGEGGSGNAPKPGDKVKVSGSRGPKTVTLGKLEGRTFNEMEDEETVVFPEDLEFFELDEFETRQPKMVPGDAAAGEELKELAESVGLKADGAASILERWQSSGILEQQGATDADVSRARELTERAKTTFEDQNGPDEDGFLYHVTSRSNSEEIESTGIVAGMPANFDGFAAHSQGNAFFTERGGVNFWAEKIGLQSEDADLVVLRHPKDATFGKLITDREGTRDSPVTAYMVGRRDSEDLELSECGANKEGGGGFTKANTCAKGGKGGAKKTDDRFGLPLNPNGTVTLFHGTDAKGEKSIRKEGGLRGKENGVFLTTAKEDLGFGDRRVAVEIDPSRIELDDEFSDGRMDFRIASSPGSLVSMKVKKPETESKPVDIQSEIKSRHGLEKFNISVDENEIHLSNIRVPEASRGEGIGRAAIEDLQDKAQELQVPITLVRESPEGRDGDLDRFYDSLGFEKPSSGSKDFSLTRHTHIWNPE